MREHEQLLPPPPANDRPGDRYICTFSGSQPPCGSGPGCRSQCPAGACRVKRSIWYRQRLATLGVSAVATLLLGVALLGRFRNEIFAPGPLTQSHAQILSGDLKSDRCAACHPAAEGGLTNWFLTGNHQHPGTEMTERCMECHHARFERELARSPHTLAKAVLDQRTELIAARRAPQFDLLPTRPLHDIECAACHREHHGTQHDLAAITNQQCQTCHAASFPGFAKGHPEFNGWPYEDQQASIRFSHRSHAGQYYPQANQTFDCRSCHTLASTGEVMTMPSYETACASCHDQAMQTRMNEGFALLAFPVVPREVVQEAGVGSSWPENARGLPTGSLPPLSRLLLSSDPATSQAVTRLGDSDFERLNIAADASVRRDVVRTLQSIVTLQDELVAGGQEALLARLIELNVEESVAKRFIDQFPVHLVRDGMSTWSAAGEDVASKLHPRTNVRLASSDSLPPSRSDEADLLETDPPQPGNTPAAPPGSSTASSEENLLESPSDLLDVFGAEPQANGQVPPRFSAAKHLRYGGWYRDELQLAYRYHPRQHADPRLTALIEIANSAEIEESLRHSILDIPSLQSCTECHNIDSGSDDTLWHAAALSPSRTGFTRFAHRPHLNIRQLHNCTTCHVVAHDQTDPLSPVSWEGHDFEPLQRYQCATCHTSSAAGDRCTQCHRYHADLVDD